MVLIALTGPVMSCLDQTMAMRVSMLCLTSCTYVLQVASQR